MKLSKQYFLLYLFVFLFICCNQADQKQKINDKQVTIIIQPFNNIDTSLVEYVYKMITSVYPRVILNHNINLPQEAYYKPRNRYKADSLLKYFNKIAIDDRVYIGLTNKDISTRKENVEDFGVMGLGFCPGKACVASSFRLDKTKLKDQLFKVAIHELGHTQGLPHCKEKFCFMRDAEGKNVTNEEKEFCSKCKLHLHGKGFKI